MINSNKPAPISTTDMTKPDGHPASYIGKSFTLSSPYGELRTVGGGRIENGHPGVVVQWVAGADVKAIFHGEKSDAVTVPIHWLKFDSASNG
jgi:hypothetical protein